MLRCESLYSGGYSQFWSTRTASPCSVLYGVWWWGGARFFRVWPKSAKINIIFYSRPVSHSHTVPPYRAIQRFQLIRIILKGYIWNKEKYEDLAKDPFLLKKVIWAIFELEGNWDEQNLFVWNLLRLSFALPTSSYPLLRISERTDLKSECRNRFLSRKSPQNARDKWNSLLAKQQNTQSRAGDQKIVTKLDSKTR